MISVKFSFYLNFQRNTYLLFETPEEAVEHGTYLLKFWNLDSIDISWITSTTQESITINNTKKL
jgi:hypothetical protein